MKIKTVYLAGGINGLSDSDANDWRTEAKRLLPREIAVLDPMSRDYRGKEDENVWEIIDGDLADIKQCEAMIAYCPRPSWGTAMEIHWTATLGKAIVIRSGGDEYGGGAYQKTLGYRRIVAVVPDGTPVSPWLRHHVTRVVPTIKDAIATVLEWNGAPALAVNSDASGGPDLSQDPSRWEDHHAAPVIGGA